MKTFDPTDILTNFRIHICKKGFQHARSNAFLEVCERDNDIFACGIITDEVDKQNLEVALCVCSKDVEENIHKHGDSHAAILFIFYKIGLWHSMREAFL